MDQGCPPTPLYPRVDRIECRIGSIGSIAKAGRIDRIGSDRSPLALPPRKGEEAQRIDRIEGMGDRIDRTDRGIKWIGDRSDRSKASLLQHPARRRVVTDLTPHHASELAPSYAMLLDGDRC